MDSCLEKDFFNAVLNEEGINILAFMRKRHKNKKKILSHDNVNKSMHCAIKTMSFQCQDRALTFLLDSDPAVSADFSTAVATDSFLQKIDILEESGTVAKVTADRLCTNARGGGGREGLACKLASLARICLLETFFVATCSLHAVNRMMQLLCKKHFSNGSTGDRNAMQLSHASFALQKKHQMCEWRKTSVKTANTI